MRFILYSIFLVFWLVMWWWTYTCHIKTSCCPEGLTPDPIGLIEVDREDPRPVVFRWSDAKPVATPAFDGLKDSLAAVLEQGQMLEITGFYYRDETPPDDDRDLGQARAEAVRDILGEVIAPERVVVRSEVAALSGDVRDRFFSAVRYRTLINNEHVQEIDDRALIYFPFNSTKPEFSQEIHAYLDAVAGRLAQTNERVILTGHTDDEGSNNSNYYLGHWRASAVRDALVQKGVEAARITVESKGELEPLAGNNTREGRERNRRVELRLIQPD
ncbi:MAG: OmpA family protein [Saprospiraceae bacterium]|nr:OmpA family protein [Saprospiraceae bacterium]